LGDRKKGKHKKRSKSSSSSDSSSSSSSSEKKHKKKAKKKEKKTKRAQEVLRSSVPTYREYEETLAKQEQAKSNNAQADAFREVLTMAFERAQQGSGAQVFVPATGGAAGGGTQGSTPASQSSTLTPSQVRILELEVGDAFKITSNLKADVESQLERMVKAQKHRKADAFWSKHLSGAAIPRGNREKVAAIVKHVSDKLRVITADECVSLIQGCSIVPVPQALLWILCCFLTGYLMAMLTLPAVQGSRHFQALEALFRINVTHRSEMLLFHEVWEFCTSPRRLLKGVMSAIAAVTGVLPGATQAIGV